jgi:hypothetical protein
MEDLGNKQVEEAVKRMKMLHILPRAIQEFKSGVINRSEEMGLLYWLDDEEKEMVKKFEEEWEGVVYHVIKTLSNIGLMYSLLYVSKYAKQWEMDQGDIQGGFVFAYVVNKDMPDCSEFGTIGIRPSFGGVIRTH